MRMRDGNHAVIAGTLPKDAEFRRVGDKQTPMVRFGIKVDEVDTPDGGREAQWVNVVAWRDLAEKCQRIEKGESVLVAGRFEKRTYTDREGEEKTSVSLIADFVGRMPFVFPAAPEEQQEIPLDEEDDLPF